MSGFQITKTKNGGEHCGRGSECAIIVASANVANGDVVNLTGTADSDGFKGVDVPNSAAVTARAYGVVIGIKPDFTNEDLSSTGLASGASRRVYVDDNPDTLFEAECDTTLAVTDVGSNIGYVGSAATANGNIYSSNMTLDGSSVNTTQTLPFRIEQLLNGKTSGVLGDRALVRLNASYDKDGAAGV